METWPQQFWAHLKGNFTRPVVWGVVVLLSVLVSSFDFFGLLPGYGFVDRLLIFFSIIAVGGCVSLFIRSVLNTAMPTLPAIREDLVVAAVLTALFVPGLYWLQGYLPEDGNRLMPATLTAIIFCGELTACALIKALEEGMERQPPRDRLMARLSNVGNARISRITSSDHHVIVFLSDGRQEKLRMRLRDAVAEIDVEPGFCIHRSHWVATRCIVAALEDDKKEQIQLNCGSVLPVGPKYRKNLVNAGILTG